MDDLNRTRVEELVSARNNADPDCRQDPDLMDEYERAAYYQGRLDEFVSQNALDERDVALIEADYKPVE